MPTLGMLGSCIFESDSRLLSAFKKSFDFVRLLYSNDRAMFTSLSDNTFSLSADFLFKDGKSPNNRNFFSSLEALCCFDSATVRTSYNMNQQQNVIKISTSKFQ